MPLRPHLILCKSQQQELVAPVMASRRTTHLLPTLGDRAFTTAAPKRWNKLPISLRNQKSVNNVQNTAQNSPDLAQFHRAAKHHNLLSTTFFCLDTNMITNQIST